MSKEKLRELIMVLEDFSWECTGDDFICVEHTIDAASKKLAEKLREEEPK